MNIPILGIVENMSYFACPDCGKKISVFGESKIEKVATNYGIKEISKLPISPRFAELADNGNIENFSDDYLDNMSDIIINLLKNN